MTPGGDGVEDERELIEGRLQLKETLGGWRHYIKDGQDDRDIHCGAYMEVKLAEGVYGLDGWIKGRYEARLDEPVKAWLFIETAGGEPVSFTIPPRALVRVRKQKQTGQQ
jgi:hypothetical protein